MIEGSYPREWRAAAAVLAGENAKLEVGVDIVHYTPVFIPRSLAATLQAVAAALEKLAPPAPVTKQITEKPAPVVTPVKLPVYITVADIRMEWDDDTQGWLDV